MRHIRDTSHTKMSRHDYDAWGAELAGRSVMESVTGRERFTGHAWDAEWLYAGTRLYDPCIGRWMSRDPLENIYPSISPYAYVASNPLQFTDPNGMIIRVDINTRNNIITVSGDLWVSDDASQDQFDMVVKAANVWNRSRARDNSTGFTTAFDFRVRRSRIENFKEGSFGAAMLASAVNIIEFVNSNGTSHVSGGDFVYIYADDARSRGVEILAYELGHLIGLGDEYWEISSNPRATINDSFISSYDIMNNSMSRVQYTTILRINQVI